MFDHLLNATSIVRGTRYRNACHAMRTSVCDRVVLAAACLFVSMPLSDSIEKASAVSPESIDVGKQLFEQNWSPRNPALIGSDGLGPLFNGQSCVTCHRQGGIGGGGEAEFNAKSVSIESMRVRGGQSNRVNLDVVGQMIRGFHPGFIDPRAGIINSLPLAHHGGTTGYVESKRAFLDQIPAIFSENGGSINAEEVRRANATPILYSSSEAGYQTTIQARLFQRNTTALFGAGLIDQVTSKQLRALEREQKKHPEISGRVSTLASGRMGRFGWRANVPTLLDFCDKACAAEVGLETRRIKQSADPTAPAYNNPTCDISDAQIRAMTDFVAALPAPTRRIPADSELRQMAARGEQLFTSIGCAVCHVPDVAPAAGLYSDLLLHDMGKESYDLNPADPYIVRATPVTRMDFAATRQINRSFTMGDDSMSGTIYYGGHYSMEAGQTSRSTSIQQTVDTSVGSQSKIPVRSSVMLSLTDYQFIAQPVPPTDIRFIVQEVSTENWSDEVTEDQSGVRKVGRQERTGSGADSYAFTASQTTTNRYQSTQTDYIRVHIEPTYFTQEWRTPPLWGVHDSAPYMHDGRAETLLEAITMHEGESKGTRDRFLSLSLHDRQSVIEFLNTLVAPHSAPQPQS